MISRTYVLESKVYDVNHVWGRCGFNREIYVRGFVVLTPPFGVNFAHIHARTL
jgi:hypothetical protein